MKNKCSFDGQLLITPTLQNTSTGEPVAALNISVPDGFLEGKAQAIFLKVLVAGARAWGCCKFRKGDSVSIKGARYCVADVAEKKLDGVKKSHYFILDARVGKLRLKATASPPEVAEPAQAKDVPLTRPIKPSEKPPAKHISQLTKKAVTGIFNETAAELPPGSEEDDELPF